MVSKLVERTFHWAASVEHTAEGQELPIHLHLTARDCSPPERGEKIPKLKRVCTFVMQLEATAQSHVNWGMKDVDLCLRLKRAECLF